MNKKFLLIGFVCFLMGCSPSLEKLRVEMALSGVQPLSAEQVKAVYSGASSYHKAEYYEFSGYYAIDGSKTGKSWGEWGEESDRGNWHVTDEGYLCGQWSGNWAKGKRCLAVYPGERDNEYIETIVIGPRFRSNPSGIYRVEIVPGGVVSFQHSQAVSSTVDE